MKTNFHTHTKYCNHADMSIEKLVNEHIKAGYTKLGISEHAPLSWKKDQWRLNSLEEVQKYINEVNEAKIKYADQIEIYCGLEVEYVLNNPIQEEWAKQLANRVDYIILANHYIGDVLTDNWVHFGNNHNQCGRFCQVLKLMQQGWETGIFTFIAHPDAVLKGYDYWDQSCEDFAHDLGKWAQATGAILEINANGIRKKGRQIEHGKYLYTNLNFWKIIAQYEVNVVVNGDTHFASEVNDSAELEARKIAKWGKLKEVKLFK